MGCVLFCFPLHLLLAQQEDSSVVELDPVVITGTRVQQQKSKIPVSVSVVTRETIERSGQTNILPVLSREVPGLFLNARGIVGFGVGPNSAGNLSIRGISGTPNTQVLVLIDGQPQFMGIFGHPIADAYMSSAVERVEVLKGAASLLYGSNALGGAINIITRDAQQQGLHGGTHLTYGSFNTGKYAGSLQYREKKWQAFATVNREQTQGYREEGKDDFENINAYLKLGYALDKELTLTGDFQIADATYYFPGTTVAPLDQDQREYLRGRASLSLENSSTSVEGAFKLFYNFGDHTFSDGFRSQDVNRGVTLYQNLRLMHDNIITLGVDYKNIAGEAMNDNLPPPARVGLNQRHVIHETDVYALMQQTFRQKLSLQGGLRLIHNSQYGLNTTPGVGITYQVSEAMTLKANAHRAFRSPTIANLFLFPPANESLQPEEVWSYELSVMQSFFRQKMSMELTGFLSKGENLIQEVASSTPGPPQGQNTGRFTNKGIEWQTKYQVDAHVQLMLNYAFLHASENVLFAPKHNFYFQVDYTDEPFTVWAGLQQVSGLTTSLTSDVAEEHYTLVHARLQWEMSAYFRVFVEGNNLLDTSYQIENNYPMPGINVLGGIGFHF